MGFVGGAGVGGVGELAELLEFEALELPAAMALAASGSQWSMIPTMVRSLGYDLLPAASRAAELPTQITQSPGIAPTASTATFCVLPSSTTCKCLC